MAGFDVTAWLTAQAGRSLADVRAEAKQKGAETKSAVIQAQRGGVAKRGRVSMQSRAVVSKASNADARMRAFIRFTASPVKRPPRVPPADWVLYQVIVASWVEQGDIDAETLKVFKR